MVELKTKEHYKNLIKSLHPREEEYEVLCKCIDGYDGSRDDQFHSLMLVLISLLSEIQDLNIVKQGFDQIAELSKDTSEEVTTILTRFKDIQDGKEPQLPVSGLPSSD